MKKVLLLFIIVTLVLSKKNRKKKVKNSRKGVINQGDGSYLSVGNIVNITHSPFPVDSTRLDLNPHPIQIVNPLMNQIAHPFISDYSLVTPEYAKPKTHQVQPMVSEDQVQIGNLKVVRQQIQQAHHLSNDDGSPIQNRVIALHGLDRKRRFK